VRQASGPASEAAACAFLERRGLHVLERNWHSRFGEIDLVLREGSTIVFVEVRLRTSSAYGGAAESIDRRKRSRLLAAARLYLAGKRERACRFDVVLMKRLDPPDIEWIRDAISE
jgi:putative endonuclease